MHAETAYLFRHALLRDAAYQLHLPSARATLHRLALEIVEALSEGDEKALGVAAEELAGHARSALLREGEVSPVLCSKHVSYLFKAFRFANSEYDRAKAAQILDDLLSLEYCDLKTRCEALRERGDLARAAAQGAMATALTTQALELAQQNGLAEQAADAKYLLCTLSMQSELNQSEMQLLQECETEYRRLGLELKQLRATSRLFMNLPRPEGMQGMKREVESMAARFSELGSHRDAARLWVMYAMRLEDAGMLSEAIDVLAKAEPEARAQNDAVALAVIEGRRGVCFKQLGDYDAALECYSRAEQHNRRAGEQMGIAINVSNRGNIHYRRSAFKKALADYQAALAVADEYGAPAHRCSFAMSLGNVWRELEVHEAAEKYYRLAIELGKHAGAERELTAALENYGGFLINANRTQEGLVFLREALGLLPRNPPSRRPNVLTNVGLAILAAGEVAEGEALLERAARMFTEQNLQFSSNCADAMAQLALLAHGRGEAERARDWAVKLAAIHGKLDKIQLAGNSALSERISDALAILAIQA